MSGKKESKKSKVKKSQNGDHLVKYYCRFFDHNKSNCCINNLSYVSETDVLNNPQWTTDFELQEPRIFNTKTDKWED
jgi:hypothetical protein